MNIILALLPAIGWGVIPLIVSKVKDSHPANQILGVGIGATGTLGIAATQAILKNTNDNLTLFSHSADRIRITDPSYEHFQLQGSAFILQ